MRARLRALTAALAAMVFGAALARAEGELTGTLKKADDSGTVTIGYRESSLPFSYLNQLKQPIGYAIDLCQEIVDDMAHELGRDDLNIDYKPVTSANRFEAVTSGAIDLECGSTTDNLERRKVVDFSPTYYVSATKLLVRKASPIRSYRDLRGKKVAVTAGTTNADAIRRVFDQLKIPAEIVIGRDHAESFSLVKEGKADALALDDVLLYGLIAAEGPKGSDYTVLPENLSYEPYGIMFRKNDPALSTLVQKTFARLAEARELRWLYEKWFLKRLPTGERLNIPMSEELAHMFQVMGMAD
ncbi:MAG: amino acid ABC transporter substrate-binding protein [Methylobacteriaceae bacterium]|nr:amino acid ABC transporter substrate-binding protein [Methylobacteriaceae bacterium]